MKRGGEAAVKIAVDLVDEGLIDYATAVGKVLPEHLDQLLHPRFPDVELPDYKNAILSSGLPASPGAAVGQIALTNDMVVSNKEKGIRSILVRDETSPDDVEGTYHSMKRNSGILQYVRFHFVPSLVHPNIARYALRSAIP